MAALNMWWKRLMFAPEMMELEKRKSEEKRETREDIFTGILAPFESYVVTLQSILIWEKPLLSSVAFTLCNILFWVVVYCQYRFYFVVASITALSYVYRTWTKQIWPEIRVPVPEDEDNEEWTPVNPQVLSVPEIGRYLNQLSQDVRHWFQWLINLRHEHPGRFCIAVTATFAVIGFFGRCVSGIFISYVLMCLIMLGPGFVVHFYPHIRNVIMNCEMFTSMEVTPTKTQADDPIDEFYPESNEEMMDALATALESSVNTEHEDANETEALHTECPEELVPSLNVMPSYDKDSDSETEVEDESVEAARVEPTSVPLLHPVPIETMMRFVSSHYDEGLDSDEAEEDRLADGLVFGDDVDNRLSCELSKEETSQPPPVDSDLAGRSIDVPTCESQQHKPPSRRPSQQSDVELSDYEMISDSELS